MKKVIPALLVATGAAFGYAVYKVAKEKIELEKHSNEHPDSEVLYQKVFRKVDRDQQDNTDVEHEMEEMVHTKKEPTHDVVDSEETFSNIESFFTAGTEDEVDRVPGFETSRPLEEEESEIANEEGLPTVGTDLEDALAENAEEHAKSETVEDTAKGVAALFAESDWDWDPGVPSEPDATPDEVVEVAAEQEQLVEEQPQEPTLSSTPSFEDDWNWLHDTTPKDGGFDQPEEWSWAHPEQREEVPVVEKQEETVAENSYYSHLDERKVQAINDYSNETIADLYDAGDVPEQERPIQHFVSFKTEADLYHFKDRMESAGFVVANGDSPLELVVLHLSDIDRAKLLSNILFIADSAYGVNGTYHGWASRVTN
ncbi:MAG: ribonuclease E inhibitor RraB [Erysipelotrichaceae bacterium]